MKEKIRQMIGKLQTLAEQKGAELDISEENFIDDVHLDCTWYGGEIAVIKYKEMTLEIGVHGDVRLTGYYNGLEIDYKNKSNTGALGTDLFYIIESDEVLHELSEVEWSDEKDDHITWGNNNWVEIFFLGTFISEVANSDNVLEAVEEVLESIEDFYRSYQEATTPCFISEVANSKNVLKAAEEVLESIEDYYQCNQEATTPCSKCSHSVNGDCELSPDDNACNGTAGEMDECAYCTAVPAESNSSAAKDFVFTYSVEGYVEVRVSANSLEEARKIATVKAGEIDCGDLRDVDWNELEVTEE